MANDESTKNNAEESRKQTENSFGIAGIFESLKNNLNSAKKYIARTGDQGLTSLNEASARNPDFIISKRNEELANKVSVFYGYTVGQPRELNEIEKLEVNSKYNTAGNSADGFRYVRFYANNTPCQAFPQISKYPKDSPQRLILESMYPEALVDVKLIGSDIPVGQIVKIEYLDKKNNLLPVILELSGDESTPLIDVEKPVSETFTFQYPGGKPQTIKRLFSENQIRDIINKGELDEEQKFNGRDRDLKKIKHFIIHDSVVGTTADMIAVLKDRGLGIHYVITKDGSLVQTADLKEVLGHAYPYNDTSIGVEVVNPTYVTNPYVDSTWDNSIISPAPWAWTPDIRKTNKFIIPTRSQMEATWGLCQAVTSDESMNIPLEFVGFDDRRQLFVITGANPYAKLDRSKSGILAHSYFKHGDGAPAALYCYLRSINLGPNEAWSKLNFLLKPENLRTERATGTKKDGSEYVYTQYYADISLLKKGMV